MIIFIAGGVTYSEMRLAYTVGQSLGKDIYIGELVLDGQRPASDGRQGRLIS
jgi:hypothetical protein